MSVVRFGEEGSQVYIIHSSMGIECCGCRINEVPRKVVAFETNAEMLAHLREHQRKGDWVPSFVTDQFGEARSG